MNLSSKFKIAVVALLSASCAAGAQNSGHAEFKVTRESSPAANQAAPANQAASTNSAAPASPATGAVAGSGSAPSASAASGTNGAADSKQPQGDGKAAPKAAKTELKGEAKAKSTVNANGLTKAEQKQIDRAAGYMRSKNWHRATEAVNAFAASAESPSTCMYAMNALSRFGGPANQAKRACVEKAISLSTSSDDLMEVAVKARQSEMFDLSKEAFDRLIGTSENLQDLTLIARESHRMAMADVAHLAMEKAYTRVDNIPDALQFARDSYAMGLEDLSRKCLKDLIEDQPTVSGLLEIAGKVEAMHMNEMVRFALTRAVDKAKTIDQMLSVYNAAKHYGEEDIVKLAQFRGRKMVLQKKIKEEAGAVVDPKTEEQRKAKEKEDQLRSNLAKPSGF